MNNYTENGYFNNPVKNAYNPVKNAFFTGLFIGNEYLCKNSIAVVCKIDGCCYLGVHVHLTLHAVARS